MKNKITIAQVRAHCRALRVPFRWYSETREFSVGGYFTDDAQDAMDSATHIASKYVKLEPDAPTPGASV